MFFTKIGSIIAYIGFGIGALQTAFGFLVALTIEDMEANIAISKRYFGASNSGEVIEKGLPIILFSVALGILCEISKSGKQPT